MQNATPVSTFRMNTCKSVSKQRTLTTFRMNTYKKQGEGGGPLSQVVTSPKLSAAHSTPASPTIVRPLLGVAVGRSRAGSVGKMGGDVLLSWTGVAGRQQSEQRNDRESRG